MAYPELVSGGVSISHKFKWLVKVGASIGVAPMIYWVFGRYLAEDAMTVVHIDSA